MSDLIHEPQAEATLSETNHRILEASTLEQGELLARVWQIDVIVIEGTALADPSDYLRSLSHSSILSTLPLVTLDTKTTEAANQIPGLSVFPGLVSENQQQLDNLLQVIQIAAGLR